MGDRTTGGLSFAGGLLKGIAGGLAKKKEEERQKPMFDLQKQLLQLKLQSMKSADKKLDMEMKVLEQQAAGAEAFRKSPLYEALMGVAGQKVESMLQPPAEAQNVGIPQVEDQPATPMGTSITGQIAQMQDVLGSMTPTQAMLAEKHLGYNFPKVLEQRERFGHYDALEKDADERIAIQRQNLQQRQKEHDFQAGQKEYLEKEAGGFKMRQLVNKHTKQPLGPWEKKSGKKGLPAETAGKLQMMKSGLDAMNEFEKILFPNGVSEKNITADTYKLIAQMQGNVPWTQGREMNSYIMDALEGKIRVESGAAVPDPEIERMALRFKPGVFDTKKAIVNKVKRLRNYLKGTIEVLDPNKNYSKETEFMVGEAGQNYAWIPPGKSKGGKIKASDIIVNPDTGEKLYWDGEEWIPLD